MANNIWELESLFPEIISISRDIDVYSTCNYKWFLQRCLHLYKYTYNTDLEAGSEFASAMEIIRLAYYKQGLPEAQAVQLGVDHLLETYGATHAMQEYPDDLKTPERMADVLRTMFQEHSMEYASIVPFEMENGELSVEQELEVELPFKHPETGKPLILRGILDLLGRRDSDAIVFGADEKTCKSVNKDAILQLDLLRTQSQFVCYTNLVNKNKAKIGDVDLTHFRINKCKVKKTYASGESVVEAYEFVIDVWFQETWWNNMLYLVQDMLEKYEKFKYIQGQIARTDRPIEVQQFSNESLKKETTFPRAYGHGCTLFFRPCPFTYHCTSGNAQDVLAAGYKQVVCYNRTKSEAVPLHDYRRHLFEGVPLEDVIPKKEEKTEVANMSFDSFLDTF